MPAVSRPAQPSGRRARHRAAPVHTAAAAAPSHHTHANGRSRVESTSSTQTTRTAPPSDGERSSVPTVPGPGTAKKTTSAATRRNAASPASRPEVTLHSPGSTNAPAPRTTAAAPRPRTSRRRRRDQRGRRTGGSAGGITVPSVRRLVPARSAPSAVLLVGGAQQAAHLVVDVLDGGERQLVGGRARCGGRAESFAGRWRGQSQPDVDAGGRGRGDRGELPLPDERHVGSAPLDRH